MQSLWLPFTAFASIASTVLLNLSTCPFPIRWFADVLYDQYAKYYKYWITSEQKYVPWSLCTLSEPPKWQITSSTRILASAVATVSQEMLLPYSIVDKIGKVNYRIHLIGGSLNFNVHYNRLKLCYRPPKPNFVTTKPISPPITIILLVLNEIDALLIIMGILLCTNIVARMQNLRRE